MSDHVFLTAKKKRSQTTLFSLFAAAALCACPKPAGIRYPNLPQTTDGALHIINFDVGQSDAMLVIYRGKSMLIDCGSPLTDPSRAARAIPRRLDALLGSRHIDYFVATHYHKDHIGGLRTRNGKASGIFSLIEDHGITVGTLIDRGLWTVDGRKGDTQKAYEKTVPDWLASGKVTDRRSVTAGDSIDLGDGLSVTVIAAAGNGYLDRMASRYPDFVKKYPPSENDYSVVLKLTMGKFEFLAGGDLTGANSMRRFGRKGTTYNDIETVIADHVGAVDVYRVHHHGSAHSSNPCFVQVLHPTVSIFSTGENTYGHPNPDVFARLKAIGAVYISGGAAEPVRSEAGDALVGDDIEILVAPDGGRYWVNDEEYVSLADEEEAARPGARSSCINRETELPKPEDFTNAADNHDD
ncbi:MAG: hypothetical protein A2289_00870 [Deltaproteobacteria bacterium RIFOXYA12_FULL_58_15]|nr:MAG: hypothetical protein A2289_00870 [Deltaproteobacteria bacterium RIFOXYA12_FULL_58_15]OGR11259.1 MAG: hypothetical protein A2341_17625 [Deltaproteobacteria bacterium RIFOXYB12_FULL_58_9]